MSSLVLRCERHDHPTKFLAGSTHTLYPEGFLDDLKVLELGGVGSRALPNGLRELGGEARPYQSYYDQRYYIKDPPAPVPAPASSNQPNKLRPSPSPMPSPVGSAMSLGPGSMEQQKEKKKKGLFRF